MLASQHVDADGIRRFEVPLNGPDVAPRRVDARQGRLRGGDFGVMGR